MAGHLRRDKDVEATKEAPGHTFTPFHILLLITLAYLYVGSETLGFKPSQYHGTIASQLSFRFENFRGRLLFASCLAHTFLACQLFGTSFWSYTSEGRATSSSPKLL